MKRILISSLLVVSAALQTWADGYRYYYFKGQMGLKVSVEIAFQEYEDEAEGIVAGYILYPKAKNPAPILLVGRHTAEKWYYLKEYQPDGTITGYFNFQIGNEDAADGPTILEGEWTNPNTNATFSLTTLRSPYDMDRTQMYPPDWLGTPLANEAFVSIGREYGYWELEPVDISVIPSTAERVDSHIQYAVYVNEDSPSANEGETPAIYSVWLADERTGTAKKVCTANPEAEAQWERMKGKNPDAVDVPLSQIASAERAWLAPGDVGKVIVEGCPDGRNYWTYIIDVDAQTAKQFPSTEGVQDRDWNEHTITLASYGYDDEGRYSFRRVYSTDGKFIRRTGGIERE